MRFDTASITKLFTAIAILQQIERGELSFDTQVVDFLGLEDTTMSRDVTVYHLLTHTSGIGDDCEEEDGENYEDLWVAKPNYSVTQTVDFLPQFAHKPANFPPGQGCRYCNCSYVLLGLMVEQISGMAYRDYVRQYVFAPAGMADSDFLRMDRVYPRVAEGSDPIRNEAGHVMGWKRNIYSYPPIGSPDSGAYVTAGDLERFMRAIHDEKLLSPELTEAFLTPQVPYRERDAWDIMYGYGMSFYVDKAGSTICYQKEGINAGVSGIIRHFPAQRISAVLFSNMEDGVWKPVWQVHDLVMAGDFDA